MTKFTGKYLCQSLNFIKKETLAQVFPVIFPRTPFLQNTFGRLLPEKEAASQDHCLKEIIERIMKFPGRYLRWKTLLIKLQIELRKLFRTKIASQVKF